MTSYLAAKMLPGKPWRCLIRVHRGQNNYERGTIEAFNGIGGPEESQTMQWSVSKAFVFCGLKASERLSEILHDVPVGEALPFRGLEFLEVDPDDPLCPIEIFASSWHMMFDQKSVPFEVRGRSSNRLLMDCTQFTHSVILEMAHECGEGRNLPSLFYMWCCEADRVAFLNVRLMKRVPANQIARLDLEVWLKRFQLEHDSTKKYFIGEYPEDLDALFLETSRRLQMRLEAMPDVPEVP